MPLPKNMQLLKYIPVSFIMLLDFTKENSFWNFNKSYVDCASEFNHLEQFAWTSLRVK